MGKIKNNMRLSIILTSLCLIFIGNLSSQDLHFKEKPLPCIHKTLKIQAHVVLNEDGLSLIEPDSILSQINYLNKMFSPICINFKLTEVAFIENFRYDTLNIESEWEEMEVLYNTIEAIDVYFVSDYQFTDEINGFSTPDGFEDQEGSIVVKKYPFINGSPADLAHQLGHYFGLINTYEGNGVELADGSNCETEGDELCDTPADNYNPGVSHESSIQQYLDLNQQPCRFINNEQDANGEYYCPDVGNIMSNYAINAPGRNYLECRCGFTADQYRAMASKILSVLGN